VNLRTHRKIVVIDGAVGFPAASTSPTRRTNACAPMPTATCTCGSRRRGRALQEVFVEDWAYATESRDFVGDVARAMPAPSPGPIRAQVLTSGPDSPWEAIHRLHVGAIHSAGKRVWLATPYFVPGEAAMMALTSAALGGLDVRLLVPKMSDSRLVTLAARSYFDDLLAAGVKVYEYGPRMLHTKALLVDDHLGDRRQRQLRPPQFPPQLRGLVAVRGRRCGRRAGAGHRTRLRLRTTRVRDDRARPLLGARLPEALARLIAPLL
jgi:cardiolipin synthase